MVSNDVQCRGLELETSADLLGAPALTKFGLHNRLELALNLSRRDALQHASLVGDSLRIGPVVVDDHLTEVTGYGVSLELACDGRTVPVEHRCDHGRSHILASQRRNVIPLVESQLSVLHRPLFLVVEERRRRRRLARSFWMLRRLHGSVGRPAPAREPPHVFTRRMTNPSSARMRFVLRLGPELGSSSAGASSRVSWA